MLRHAYLLDQEHNRHAPRSNQNVAVHAEEWNSIAEGGPDFYTAHLMPPEPQPSVASMLQGKATSCLSTLHPQQLKLLLDKQSSHFGLKRCLLMPLHIRADFQPWCQHNYNLLIQHHLFVRLRAFTCDLCACDVDNQRV